MSIQTNFPAIKPTLLLDFANTEELDSRVTFTRASTATYYGTQTAKAEENLLLQSQTLDNASWTKSNAAVSGTDTIVAPDGTTTAEEVRDGTATNIHSAFQGLTLASGTTYVASVFLKNVDRQYAILAVSGSVSAYASAKFDLIGGTSTANQAGGAGWSVTSVAMTPVGSDWYRCVLVFVSGTSGSCNVRIGLASDGTTFTTNGSGLESYTGTDLKIAVWGAQLEQRSAVTAYTPTTTQAITNYIPQLLTAASGVARFDHNPTTFESLGLLIEESRTNLLTYSEQFDNAAWTKSASSITANTIVSPDGTVDADKLVEDTATSSHGIFSATAPTTTIGVVYTVTVFAKKAERNFLQIFFTGGHVTGNPRANYDLNAGTLGTVDSGITATITAVGNGWYRCVATVTAATTALRPFLHLVTSSSAARNESYTGDGYSGIYIWGAQLEAGAFATSYIPTVASQVTRAADAASMTGTNFSSWFNQQQGSLYVEATPRQTAAQYVAIIGDGVNNTLGIGFFIDNSELDARVRGSGGVSTITGGLVVSANTSFKTALSYSAYNNAWSANGETESTGNTNIKPENSATLQIGSAPTGGTNLTGTIKKLSFYPVKLTDAQMNALTS